MTNFFEIYEKENQVSLTKQEPEKENPITGEKNSTSALTSEDINKLIAEGVKKHIEEMKKEVQKEEGKE